MGRAGKWLRSFLTGKKERDREKKGDGDRSGVLAGEPPAAEDKPAPVATPPPPKEKRRWSFRRSVGGGRDLNSPEPTANAPVRLAGQDDQETEEKRHAVAAVAAAAGAAVAAAQAAAAVIRLTAASAPGRSGAVEEAAAVKIQSIFRAYLARKALRALKGLVKLQALVRGHLVRKQATATLRCMQALVTAQARARAQRIRMAEDAPATPLQRLPTHRRSPLDPRHRSQPYEMDRDLEEDIKIVEMDLGESKGSTKSRNSYSITPADRSDHRLSPASYYRTSIPDLHLPAATSLSPTSALTDKSPRACSGHFEEFSFPTAQSTPHYYSSAVVSKLEAGKPPPGAPRREEHADCSLMSSDHPLYPNYMANTESSKAKSRSQSAPKQRPEMTTCERPPSRRRPSVEGRSVPRGVRMQRSSSHVGSSATNGHQYPWSLKLDRSSVSLKDSECGSTSTALTNTIYCKSLVSYEIYGTRY